MPATRTLTNRARLEKARRVKAQRRRNVQKEARQQLRRISPRYKRLCAGYAVALSVYGAGSPQADRAWKRLKPVEVEWIGAALQADKVGVEL